jgi:hypothetical protein
VVVQGGSLRGGSGYALVAAVGGKAVAEGAVLESLSIVEDQDPCTAMATEQGSMLVLRRCELRVSSLGECSSGINMHVGGGARATAADCACSGRIAVEGQGSSLLHTGLAFPPGMELPIIAANGGVARGLPAAAGAAAGARPGVEVV